MFIEAKSEFITIRLTPKQAGLLRAYAEQDSIRLSTWIRQLALEEAGRRLAHVGASWAHDER